MSAALSVFTPEHEPDRRLADLLHDLRTPLNQIIGLSEMLVEIAEEDGHRDLLAGLNGIREGGLELAHLLEDSSLIATSAEAGQELCALSDAVRAPLSRVLGFSELVLAEEPDVRLEGYRGDLAFIAAAGRNFLAAVRGSGLLLRSSGEPSEEAEEPALRREPGQATGHALIVDDESLNREVLCRRLQREGYRATGAPSGRAALALLREHEFDAILLDLQMPEMSGIDVLQALKQDETLRHLPVIMLSALTDVERVARCVELGADDYLPKPVNSVLLRARLSACLEKKRLRDQEQAHFHDLHAEKERLSVTLRSLADAVVTTDAQGRIVLFNEVAAELTGVSGEAAGGQPFGDVFRLVRRETGESAADLAAAALAARSIVDSERGLGLNAPDGSERIVSARSAPIYDPAGGVTGTVVVVRDITEKEKMAEEVLRASKLQSIGVLAGGLAHDFNNMLTAVMGNLSLLRHRWHLPADALSTLEEAERGASRAQELTRYLLTFADGGAPVKERVAARALIEETIAFVLRAASVQGELRLPAELWDTEADPSQFAQVISNVVINAVEATPDGGRLVVTAENLSAPPRHAPRLPAGDYLCIAVQDSGPGIPPAHLSRIFDPFFTTKKQARGLGLAAAYSIVQRHGGHLTVESSPGLGTTARLYLPALRPLEPAPALASAAARPAASIVPRVPRLAPRKLRVLVMDDEEAIRLLAATMLETMDYEVATAPDGETALALHAAAREAGRPFDLAVMDLTIPGGMGGKETIRRLRETDRSLRAIVSSGYSNDPIMAHHIDFGFDAVLPKPYVVNDLLRVVRELSPF